MNDNRNWYSHYYERPEYDPQHRHHANNPHGWDRNRAFEENNMQDNYDYGNYTSDFGGNRNYDQNYNQGYGSYEGAPTGFQEHHPNNPNPYEGIHGYNDYGYAAGNDPDFQMRQGSYSSERWSERNGNSDAAEQPADRFYPPQNMRQREYGPINDYYNNHLGRINPRPQGQTMDSWDNDDNHWHTQKFNRSGFSAHREDHNRDYHYRPQNQGYFGENMPPHSGGDLYNERFRNEDDSTRYNPEENRWHADSLSDRNIEGWGR